VKQHYLQLLSSVGLSASGAAQLKVITSTNSSGGTSLIKPAATTSANEKYLPSACTLYGKEYKMAYAKAHPKLSSADVKKALFAQWKQLPDIDRAPFIRQEKDMKADAGRRRDQAARSVKDGAAQATADELTVVQTALWKLEQMADDEVEGGRDDATTAAAFYVAAKTLTYTLAHPQLDGTDVNKALVAQWDQLTDVERTPFIEEEKQMKERAGGQAIATAAGSSSIFCGRQRYVPEWACTGKYPCMLLQYACAAIRSNYSFSVRYWQDPFDCWHSPSIRTANPPHAPTQAIDVTVCAGNCTMLVMQTDPSPFVLARNGCRG